MLSPCAILPSTAPRPSRTGPRSAAQRRPQNMRPLIIGYDSIVRRRTARMWPRLSKWSGDDRMRCTGGYRTAGRRIQPKCAAFLDNEVERLTTKRATNRLSAAFALCSALVSCGLFPPAAHAHRGRDALSEAGHHKSRRVKGDCFGFDFGR